MSRACRYRFNSKFKIQNGYWGIPIWKKQQHILDTPLVHPIAWGEIELLFAKRLSAIALTEEQLFYPTDPG